MESPDRSASPETPTIVALCLSDEEGRFLIQKRPAGRTWAGFWEFPGGKVKPGERPEEALRREVVEEVGIEVGELKRFCRHAGPTAHGRVSIGFYAANAFSGSPAPRDGQTLAWSRPAELPARSWLPADQPLVDALASGPWCGLTPRLERLDPHRIASGFARAVASGVGFFVIRKATGSSWSLAEREPVRLWARRQHVRVAFGHTGGTVEGADDLHLTAESARSLNLRPVPQRTRLGVSCHDSREIGQAARLGADYLFLGPLQPTPSHPGSFGVGWERWSEWARAALCPVYAIGGLGPADLDQVRRAGGFGVAAIRAFWDE
jgi:8-oxo-dGTP diphosphatase